MSNDVLKPRQLLGWILLGALATAAVLVGLLYLLLAINDGSWEPLHPQGSGRALESAEWFDFVRTAVTAATAFAIGGTIVLAYRRQVTHDRNQITSEGNLALERSKEEIRREEAAKLEKSSLESTLRAQFATATEQLGHPQAASRLAGVYSMAVLADRWAAAQRLDERQVCIDVLCAYLRLPYDPTGRAGDGEREVRWTVIKVIREHLQGDVPAWVDCPLDFTGATFDGGDFSGAMFRGSVSFRQTRFVSGEVRFNGARFAGGKTLFRGAKFSGAQVRFLGAAFLRGTVDFQETVLSSGSLSFRSARFAGGDVQFTTRFKGGRAEFPAEFDGATVKFTRCRFLGSDVSFRRAQFKRGRVSFYQCKFESGSVTGLTSPTSGPTRWRFSQGEYASGVLEVDGANFTDDGTQRRVPETPSVNPSTEPTNWEEAGAMERENPDPDAEELLSYDHVSEFEADPDVSDFEGIDITESDGPDLEAGDYLDTGAAISDRDRS